MGTKELAEMIEKSARREAQTLARYQSQRKIPPLTAATAATLVSVETFALAADDETKLELALASLANIARTHALTIFRARANPSQENEKCPQIH